MENTAVLHITCLLVAILCVGYGGVFALTNEEKSKFTSDVSLTVSSSVYKFTSNGYPDHAIDNSVNPNAATKQNYAYSITINPPNTGDTVWCANMGPIGFATNGVAIYNALTAESTDAVMYEKFDSCVGHSGPNGGYHYHQFPVCLGSVNTTDLFIGIALDGNPIYGPMASDRTTMLTSKDLDACHGRFVSGKYRYHITTDFPYVIGCFQSEPASTGITQKQTTCSNKDNGAQLCDCEKGTLTHSDTLNTGSTTATAASRILLVISGAIAAIANAYYNY